MTPSQAQCHYQLKIDVANDVVLGATKSINPTRSQVFECYFYWNSKLNLSCLDNTLALGASKINMWDSKNIFFNGRVPKVFPKINFNKFFS